MYETEANNKTETADQLPQEVIEAFGASRKTMLARSVLPWSEHCTECVWPTCYATCDLYSPRPQDGRCRRFADGMVRIHCPSALNEYVLKIRFKRWGKLWSPGSIRLYSAEQALRLEKRDHLIGATLYQLPLPSDIKRVVTGKRYSFKKRVAASSAGDKDLPTSFVIECYNADVSTVRLSLTLRCVDEQVKIPFQKLIEIGPGFHRVRVPMAEIRQMLDVRRPFSVELIPNEDEKETTLYFGLMEFVREVALPAEKAEAKKIKCVVWDLDNTLWDGILVEQGPEKLQLKQGIAEIVRTLDERGILQSIASKNNHDEALQAVRRFHLDEYFLYPQVSWHPKSEAMKAIAGGLNIGLDSLLFVDDSEFELAQVKQACPDVRVLNSQDYRTLPQMQECQVPVTAESKSRRAMYRTEEQRQNTVQSFGDDYMAFLRHCGIELSIHPMTESNLERVHELTQRTNQMNFSGNRYDRGVLRSILTSPHLDTYVLSCEDRFGSYGIVGFSIVDNREPRMTDLMFSCRIQSKRVEHAFLSYILRKHGAESENDFWSDYRKTPRNAPSGQVFADMGMEEVDVRGGVTSLVFRKGRQIPDDAIIKINAHRDSLSLA